MCHEEYSKLQVIMEGKVVSKQGIGKKKKTVAREEKETGPTQIETLNHQARKRDIFALVVTNLNRDGT